MTATIAASWNGPTCHTCGKAYLGTHTCNPADLLRRAADLIDLANRPEPVSRPIDSAPNRTCPCRPENGGSGVCGCILGGYTVTCGATTNTSINPSASMTLRFAS